MRVNHCFGNSEPKAEAAIPTGDRTLALLKCVKDLVDLFRFDPDPGVGDANFNLFRCRIQRLDDDPPAGWRELHAIFDEVPKDLLKPRRIGFDVGLRRVQPEYYVHALSPG